VARTLIATARATFGAFASPFDNRVTNPIFASVGANWNTIAGSPSIGTGSGNDVELKAIPWSGKKGTVSKGADGRTSGYMALIDKPQDYIIQNITSLPTYVQNGSTAKVNGLY